MGGSSGRDFNAIFQDICRGDQNAFEFCRIYLVFSHFQDDFIDSDHPPSPPEAVVRLGIEWLMTLAFNPFWLQHKSELLPLIRSGSRAFLDSISWARREDPNERMMANALKVQYGEVFWSVARIIGGESHASEITQKYRHYQFDAETVGPAEPPSLLSNLGSVGVRKSRLGFLKEICGGDTEAKKFAQAFLRFCGWLDDAVDQNAGWHAEDVVEMNLDTISAFSENPFFERNKNYLMPLVLTSARAWGDSIQWAKKKDVQDRRASEIFGCFYHDVLFACAYLVGGWDHYSSMTARYREYDYEIL